MGQKKTEIFHMLSIMMMIKNGYGLMKPAFGEAVGRL
jgi:hypothetical protein